eukprot:912079-Rhodomonas_salina.1
MGKYPGGFRHNTSTVCPTVSESTALVSGPRASCQGLRCGCHAKWCLQKCHGAYHTLLLLVTTQKMRNSRNKPGKRENEMATTAERAFSAFNWQGWAGLSWAYVQGA